MEKFQFEYVGDFAKKIMPRIALHINKYWKTAKFPSEGINELGIFRNSLYPTDNNWESRQYNIIFTKNNVFGSPDYTRISFNTSDINRIQTNSSSDEPPTQIIIYIRNNVSIWLDRGRFESVGIEIFTEEK